MHGHSFADESVVSEYPGLINRYVLPFASAAAAAVPPRCSAFPYYTHGFSKPCNDVSVMKEAPSYPETYATVASCDPNRNEGATSSDTSDTRITSSSSSDSRSDSNNSNRSSISCRRVDNPRGAAGQPEAAAIPAACSELGCVEGEEAHVVDKGMAMAKAGSKGRGHRCHCNKQRQEQRGEQQLNLQRRITQGQKGQQDEYCHQKQGQWRVPFNFQEQQQQQQHVYDHERALAAGGEGKHPQQQQQQQRQQRIKGKLGQKQQSVIWRLLPKVVKGLQALMMVGTVAAAGIWCRWCKMCSVLLRWMLVRVAVAVGVDRLPGVLNGGCRCCNVGEEQQEWQQEKRRGAGERPLFQLEAYAAPAAADAAGAGAAGIARSTAAAADSDTLATPGQQQKQHQHRHPDKGTPLQQQQQASVSPRAPSAGQESAAAASAASGEEGRGTAASISDIAAAAGGGVGAAAAASGSGLGEGLMPVVFLHGVGGLALYVHMIKAVADMGHPLLVLDMKHVGLRLR